MRTHPSTPVIQMELPPLAELLTEIAEIRRLQLAHAPLAHCHG